MTGSIVQSISCQIAHSQTMQHRVLQMPGQFRQFPCGPIRDTQVFLIASSYPPFYERLALRDCPERPRTQSRITFAAAPDLDKRVLRGQSHVDETLSCRGWRHMVNAVAEQATVGAGVLDRHLMRVCRLATARRTESLPVSCWLKESATDETRSFRKATFAHAPSLNPSGRILQAFVIV